jgi:hypothetical protein
MAAKAFDEMMNQFIGDLANTFPDDQTIKAAKEKPMSLTDFMAGAKMWSDKLSAKDEAFFVEENPVVKTLNLHVIWKSEEASAKTKAAIWEYLSNMYFMGTAFSFFPPEMMAMIESTAAGLAQNLQSTGGEIDQRAISQMASQIVNNSMFGGGAPRGQPQRRRSVKPNKKSR